MVKRKCWGLVHVRGWGLVDVRGWGLVHAKGWRLVHARGWGLVHARGAYEGLGTYKVVMCRSSCTFSCKAVRRNEGGGGKEK